MRLTELACAGRHRDVQSDIAENPDVVEPKRRAAGEPSSHTHRLDE